VSETVVYDGFEWDADKAEANVRKHGVTFEEAVLVFADPSSVEGLDDSSNEARLTIIGAARKGVVFVVFIERGVRVRIISARPATKVEVVLYQAPRRES
jgi:uncharacterized protein